MINTLCNIFAFNLGKLIWYVEIIFIFKTLIGNQVVPHNMFASLPELDQCDCTIKFS